MLYDTHAHILAEQFDEDRDALIERLGGEIGLFNEIATDEAYGFKARDLAHRHDFIYFAVGIHPHEAGSASKDYVDVLEELLADEKCVALGEIGLDYHYDFAPRDVQKKIFEEQLDLAVRLDMPVCIHDREAHADVMDLISARKGKLRGVMHCYSGHIEHAKLYTQMGFYISFAGPVTFKNAGKLPEVAAWVPDAFILAETDCPYLSPEPKRGRRNEPGNVRHVVEKLADIRGVGYEEMEALTCENGKRLFMV